MSRMEEFRAFVNKYPLIKNEVHEGKKTWQNIYEDWVLFGETSDYEKYKENTSVNNDINKENTSSNTTVNLDSIKSIVNYIQKLDPDSVNKTLNTVQKVIQIVQTVGPKGVPSIPPINGLYSDWWD